MSTHEPAEGADRLAPPAGGLPASPDHRVAERAAVDRAFSAFYRESITRLTGYLIVSGTPARIAADIAQEAMIELYKRWESVQYPRTYAYKTAGRRWARRVADLQREALVDELPESTSLLPQPDALAEFEARQQMLQVLKTLPLRQRQVLFLTLQSFTPTEIAEQLELEAATVRAHLMRARRAAAARIREGEAEE
ncbi:RNA polymerase sigma factor [Streptomyces antimycoticus]|uniref:RNA polymerase sigma factor 70 region 4 type 2 domain-containing protein n=1 Tax=Streptomyces antimycoticus TaxID=68175 RepID=A0A4D4KR74_9ACTN|nr:sigma-70 family RNA polymerase sigma factor [Streptomyces antimycoticus]GDY49080.1 hypothetical protein SANT12839_099620 [Streptomyces antimycoticus]